MSTIPACSGRLARWFFSFLRSGEFTFVPNQGEALLTPEEIWVGSCHCYTFLVIPLISGRRTDPFGTGCTLYCTPSYTCPVVAVLAYLAIRPPLPGPLFIYMKSSPLHGLAWCLPCGFVRFKCIPLPLHRPYFPDRDGRQPLLLWLDSQTCSTRCYM